jgi:hypothetical protein
MCLFDGRDQVVYSLDGGGAARHDDFPRLGFELAEEMADGSSARTTKASSPSFDKSLPRMISLPITRPSKAS